jgi:hypothetical protein
MPLRVTDLPADRLEASVAAAFFFADQRPLQGPAALLDWRLNGQLTTLLREGRAEGRAGEHVVIANNGKLRSDWVLFAGGGRAAGLEPDRWRKLLRGLLDRCRTAGFASLALALETGRDFSRSQAIALIEELLGDPADGSVDCLVSLRELEAGGIQVLS